MRYKPALIFACPAKVVFLLGMFVGCRLFSYSQVNVRFQADGLPAGHLPDSIFIAGNFNGWNPGKNGNLFSSMKGVSFIELPGLPEGEYQFKFTRGNWQSVECKVNGGDAANRSVTITTDTVFKFTIEAWKDDFAPAEKDHTASPNVQMLDSAFLMPQLGRSRRIWLYLPPGYTKNSKRYPVMYMHDGQNIFDESTAGFGEWGVDECIDSMVRKGKPGCIIVGIDNGPKRLNEYNPYPFKDFGPGEGDLYLDFIVNNLKPYIDAHYRTFANPQNTIIAGSSMGGLISYYAMLKYPEVFGKGGVFSPAFWTADKIGELTDAAGKNIKGTLFFYIGGKEGERYVNDMKEVTDKLGKNSSALMYVVVDPAGGHNEQAWRKWFPEFYKWVLANGFNNIIKLEED